MTFNWGEFRAEIERLYMREGKSLEEVRDTLKAAHSFNPSVRAYKLKFGEWGYIKYNPRPMRTAEALISSRDLDLFQTTQAASSILAKSDSDTVKQNLTQIENELQRQASALNEQRVILGKVSRKRRRQHYEPDTEELDNSLKSLTKHEASITRRKQNLDKLRTSVSIQTSGPTGFASFWMQEPMVLEDAHGNVVPLPLELVISWEMLEGILVSRFQTLPGAKKVQKREFELEDSLTKGTLSRKMPWAEFSKPGRKVDMSMTFKDASKTSVVCPKCDTISKEKKGVQVECSNPDCKMIFRTEDEEPDKISSPESRPRQVKRRRTVQPTTVDSPLEEEPEDHPATSRPLWLWESPHASSMPTERYSTASSLTQPESMIRPEVSTTKYLTHMFDQWFGSSSTIHQSGVDGYQLPQNMWQGEFNPPIQGSQGDSRSEALIDTSTQAIPTTMNVKDRSQFFGINGDLSDMSGAVPKTPNHPIDGSELPTQLPAPCLNCTFQNHPTLTSCEMCGTDLLSTPGAHFRTVGLAQNTASEVTLGNVLSSGQIKRMESGNVIYNESSYEVFDPLNWMLESLDGLVDFPYSYSATNERKTEESINSGQSSVDLQRSRSTTPTETYLEVLSLSSSAGGWETVDQFPNFEAY